jgi:hypothetical protein
LGIEIGQDRPRDIDLHPLIDESLTVGRHGFYNFLLNGFGLDCARGEDEHARPGNPLGRAGVFELDTERCLVELQHMDSPRIRRRHDGALRDNAGG